MARRLIDQAAWPRREHYEHYLRRNPCTYTVTVQLDITALQDQRLYPTMLWLLTRAVNTHEAFRTTVTPQGPGIFSDMHPAYTIMGKGSETFTCVWTAFHADFQRFLRSYEEDAATYANSPHLFAKANRPENSFDVSMLPWFTFSAFNLHLYNAQTYTLPVFTIGKAVPCADRTMLPLAIQVHHAVCDGFHVAQFVDTLQQLINDFADLP
ncbi:MAG: type A chloramphenicol O-acetyltransferase [Clostridia bacterium]|nr:type A chloramphenicol O-acetyltransferase [Clostridia bacterium]